MPKLQSSRKKHGQSLTEVLVGGIVLVPIVLAIIDLAVVVIGGELVNDLAKQAARGAANANSQSEAAAAVVDVQSSFSKSPTYKNLNLKLEKYDGTNDGLTTVLASVIVVLPVPLPFLKLGPEMALKTQATEPIIGIPDPRPK